MRILLFFLLFSTGRLAGQYLAFNIPDTLHRYAHAVVREEELLLDVISPAEMEYRHRQVITILDKQGLEHALLVVPYDKFQSVRELGVTHFDMLGQPVKSYRKKDFQDIAYLDDLTMASDARYLLLDLRTQSPPFTIEFVMTAKSKGILTYPDFLPQSDYGVSVEKSRCEVRVPASQTLLYKGVRSPEPEVSRSDKTTTYVWAFRNLPAVPDEPYNLPVSQLAPMVRLSPRQFEMGNFTGSFDSWDGIAQWNRQMVAALPPLNEKAVQEIREATRNMPERERIRTVYRLMQNSTRYVSIQLGIGGWQPFDPNFVHAKKYGDCKALSWYTRALLEAAGIKSYYTLVYAGDNPREVDPAFPDNIFNHVILTVPAGTGDTLWLECTSQICPFGYIGTFTGNRNALAIDDEKASIIHLPAPPAEKNLRTDSVQIQLSEDRKTARIEWNAQFSGMAIEDDHFYAAASYADPQERKKWIEDHFSIKGGQIESFTLGMDSTVAGQPGGRVKVLATSAQLLNATAQRLYFQPNFFQPWKTALKADSARVSPVYRRFGHTYIADLQVAIPAGWSPEAMPAPVEESTPFGAYSRTVSFANGALHYRRRITLQAGTFPAGQYNDLFVLFKKMKKWDAEQVVFVKKD